MKTIFLLLLCMLPVVSVAQKSIIEQPKPKTVKLSISQKKTAGFLDKAGNCLAGGAVLFAIGSFVGSQEGGRKTIGMVMQAGGAGLMVFSGINLINAGKSYEKSLREIKLEDMQKQSAPSN